MKGLIYSELFCTEIMLSILDNLLRNVNKLSANILNFYGMVRHSGAVGAQFLGGPKVQIFRRWDNFSDKTNSSEPPFDVLFLKVSQQFMKNLVMYWMKDKMRKREYLITNLKMVDSIENLSLVTFEFRVPTTFLAIVFLQKHHISHQNLMISTYYS